MWWPEARRPRTGAEKSVFMALGRVWEGGERGAERRQGPKKGDHGRARGRTPCLHGVQRGVLPDGVRGAGHAGLLLNPPIHCRIEPEAAEEQKPAKHCDVLPSAPLRPARHHPGKDKV